MNTRTAIALGASLGALGLVLSGPPAQAHHAFAMFDTNREITLDGTVKEFQWTNPHVWIQLVVPDASGKPQEWGVECTSVNFLRREGWDKGSLKPGDKVKLLIFPLKDGSHGGQLNKVVELNGSTSQLPGYQ